MDIFSDLGPPKRYQWAMGAQDMHQQIMGAIVGKFRAFFLTKKPSARNTS